jgi:sulfate/thiosulfate transport system permease protein
VVKSPDISPTTRNEKTLSIGQYSLIGLALFILTVVLIIPTIAIIATAFSKGFQAYATAFMDSNTLSAIGLTLLTCAIVTPLSILFGIIAAWTVSKYDFKFKNTLITLIDLPFSISPVISGLIFILTFGTNSLIGGWLATMGISIIFAIPGIILASLFVTFPFVFRELAPLMQAQGREEEEAATVLGASGLQTFFKVTLPNISWGILYGAILSTARCMGEFGAVSIVSGHISGYTNTLPLHIEILYNEYQHVAAFTCATFLLGIALLTLVLKKILSTRLDHSA